MAEEDYHTSDNHPKWNAVRRTVCDFLETAVDPKHPLSPTHAAALWALVENLALGGDPELERERDAGTNLGGPYGDAINRTRSRAIEMAIGAAQWSNNLPKVHQLLEARFRGEPPLTLPERSLLAVNFPRMMALDATWTRANAGAFFPRTPQVEWLSIFTDYLLHTRPYTNIWVLLKAEFDHALKNFPAIAKSDPQHHRDLVSALGHHFILYYLWGLTPLAGPQSLLQRYLSQAGEAKRGELFGHLGYLMHHAENLPPEVMARVEAYFVARASVHDSLELENFTLWLGAKCLPAAWRLRAFLRLLDHPAGDFSAYSEVSTLKDLVTTEPDLVVACFAKIAANAHRQRYFHLKKDDVQAILKVGLGSSNADTGQHARFAIDSLVKLGRHEYVEGLE